MNDLMDRLKKFGYPQMMLTRNTRSWLGSKIASETKGFYNHFCWLIGENEVASQDWIFHNIPLADYLTDCYVVKFITDTRWTDFSKDKILTAIRKDLDAPTWKRLYDPVAILGQWTKQTWIQLPVLDICSDYGKYLKLTDAEYNLKRPPPSDINQYQKIRKSDFKNYYHGYEITARWTPEDF